MVNTVVAIGVTWQQLRTYYGNREILADSFGLHVKRNVVLTGNQITGGRDCYRTVELDVAPIRNNINIEDRRHVLCRNPGKPIVWANGRYDQRHRYRTARNNRKRLPGNARAEFGYRVEAGHYLPVAIHGQFKIDVHLVTGGNIAGPAEEQGALIRPGRQRHSFPRRKSALVGQTDNAPAAGRIDSCSQRVGLLEVRRYRPGPIHRQDQGIISQALVRHVTAPVRKPPARRGGGRQHDRVAAAVVRLVGINKNSSRRRVRHAELNRRTRRGHSQG